MKRAKWVRWLRVIGDDIGRLRRWRDTFAAGHARSGAAGGPAGDARAHVAPGSEEAFAATVREVYTHAMAIGIRRQLKLGSRNVSVAGLLEDVAAGAGGAVDPAMVRRDLASLRRAAKPIEAFADRVVAHTDRRSGRMPDADTLSALVDQLAKVHAKYRQLIED